MATDPREALLKRIAEAIDNVPSLINAAKQREHEALAAFAELHDWALEPEQVERAAGGLFDDFCPGLPYGEPDKSYYTSGARAALQALFGGDDGK